MPQMPQQNDLVVSLVPIGEVNPYERNPRENSSAVGRVAESIREFGWRQPIVVDEERTIIAGHTRYEAAKVLGFDLVPIHVAKGLSPAQVRAYRLADNRTGEYATWDLEPLKLELADLNMEGYQLGLTGFLDKEINGYLRPDLAPRKGDDAVPEAPRRCEAGELWTLGKHRLMCGSATSQADVRRLLGNSKPNLCVTDPPYGVNYEPEWREDAGLEVCRRGRATNDDTAGWKAAWDLIPGNIVYTWTVAGPLQLVAVSDLEDAGFELRAQIIWTKPHFPISRGHYAYRHEACWYAVRKGKTAAWIGPANASSLWPAALDETADGGHSNQKPVELFSTAIANHEGDVYDPFVGSGTSLIACEKVGRVGYAMEIEPTYCDIVIARWEQYTNGKAIRDGGNAS